MRVLVVNIGSTSLKYRVFDMADERVLARGAVEGVGSAEAEAYIAFADAAGADGPRVTQRLPVSDPAEAVALALSQLTRRADGAEALHWDAIGFKAVHGGDLVDGVVTDALLATMEAFADIAPAHNPAYIAAMRAFGERLPHVPQVAVFETGFHRTVAEARRVYAAPHRWKREHGVERYGFHGASHRYIAQHVIDRLGMDQPRIVSCHLGGSSSICALRGERSLANSFGMTPQSGVPHNNRVGEFDAFALPFLSKRTGQPVEALLAELAREGGLLGVSGLSNDMRTLLAAADDGIARAELAVTMFVHAVRDYLGAYAVLLGGLDVLVFTGGIGERSPQIRDRVCAGLGFLGIALDARRNTSPPADGRVSPDDGAVTVLAVETNEELVVARRTVAVLGATRAEDTVDCTSAGKTG
jgi:acetate kinase